MTLQDLHRHVKSMIETTKRHRDADQELYQKGGFCQFSWEQKRLRSEGRIAALVEVLGLIEGPIQED